MKTPTPAPLRLWLDADACPRAVKAFVFKVSGRLQLPVILVANSGMATPHSPLVSLVVVGKAIDEADQYIVQHAVPGDLVVTADIPLAALLVDQGVVVLDPRGTVFTPANVKEALATRNLMHELRESGVLDGGATSGGPGPLASGDHVKFANALDREVTRLLRQRG